MGAYKKLNIRDFDDFPKKNKKHEDGVLELQLDSWNEFHNVVKKFSGNKDYIWRGQDGAELLQSTFDRRASGTDRRQELNRIFNQLKQRLKAVRNIDDLTDNEIWAIGQHYGLPTPLLDWTASPYIASYFAFNKKCMNNQTNAVIYALNRALKLLVTGGDRFVEFDLSKNNFDLTQNNRLANQKGKFTKSLKGEDIESVLRKFWRKTGNKYKDELILVKVLIPNTFRDECLNCLEFMNITHGILFPDYAGAVEMCMIDLGFNHHFKAKNK